MNRLEAIIHWQGRDWKADLHRPYGLAIPLHHEAPQPNAFFAPLYEAAPHRDGEWVGDTREGASVNFYNIRLNPHGNGTHTECVGHITPERYSVQDSLGAGFFVAQLVSAWPVQQPNGDRVVETLEWQEGIEALILRTLPNSPDKLSRQYGQTNPPYLAARLVSEMATAGIRHLLIDLPSVDREEDAGALAA